MGEVNTDGIAIGETAHACAYVPTFRNSYLPQHDAKTPIFICPSTLDRERDDTRSQ